MAPSCFSGRGCGDTRMWEMYSEYADIASSDDSSGRIKARLTALFAFAESQGLTGSSALEGLQKLKSDLTWELRDSNRFALFYGFVFFICRERGQKSLAVSTSVQAWHLSMSGRFCLLDQWCSFVQKHQRRAISEDTWRQFLEFSLSINEDFSNYDPEGAWPVLVDDFVDYLCSNARSCRKELSCPHTLDDGFIYETDGREGVRKENLANVHHQSNQTPLSGTMLTTKRQHAEHRCETSDVESVNCIAKRLAEMSSPLSHKRLRPSNGDDSRMAMGVPAEGARVQDMNLDAMEIPEETFEFLDHHHHHHC